MIADLLTVVTVAILAGLVVTMWHRRHRDPRGTTLHAGSAVDLLQRVAVPGTPPAPPPRDPDAAGRDVVEHLRRLEERAVPGLAGQVLPVFLRDTAHRVESLREAVAAKDDHMAHRLAHTMHGSAAAVGAATMVRVCAELIRAVRSGSFDQCDELIAELEADLESIRRATAANNW
jgi:HPt (histidine-containing phosphotransfer) domain-containing protein